MTDRTEAWLRGCRRHVLVSLGLALVAACGGCASVGYMLSVAAGQLDVLANSVPIEEALTSGGLSEEQKSKLEYVLDVRRFAVEEIGLNAGDSFTVFYDTGGAPAGYNLSAAPKDALTPKTWQFPIVGVVPYLGFFDEASADRAADDLADRGYDTMLYEVEAYSTLGWFADPVRSSMLERDEIYLADVIIHELTHNTVFSSRDAEFNETLATFVGRTGATQFLEAQYPDRPDVVELARHRFEDSDRFYAFIRRLHNTMKAHYAQPLSRDEKIARRDAVFRDAVAEFVANEVPEFHYPDSYGWVADVEVNNAWILAYYRYNADPSLYQDVYDAVGQDWKASIGVFREAARADQPQAYLREYLQAQ